MTGFINDADYTVFKDGRHCPFYRKWRGMIQRCSSMYQEKYPSYIGCSISEEWHTFSKFKSWMEKQDWKGKSLDKDLLGDGKLYSKETCLFLPEEINKIVSDKPSINKGVEFTPSGKYRSRVSLGGKYLSFGTYNTIEEAKKVSLTKKLEHLSTLIMKYELYEYEELLIDKVMIIFNK